VSCGVVGGGAMFGAGESAACWPSLESDECFQSIPASLTICRANTELDVATVGGRVHSAVVYASCNSAANAPRPTCRPRLVTAVTHSVSRPGIETGRKPRTDRLHTTHGYSAAYLSLLLGQGCMPRLARQRDQPRCTKRRQALVSRSPVNHHQSQAVGFPRRQGLTRPVLRPDRVTGQRANEVGGKKNDACPDTLRPGLHCRYTRAQDRRAGHITEGSPFV
jgi:hypothetical protein